jgi:hypothetical protein
VLTEYSSNPIVTSALEEGGWSAPRPGRFSPGKETRLSMCRRLGGPGLHRDSNPGMPNISDVLGANIAPL